MESYILISELNDFIFCPRSIYWHHVYGKYNTSVYHTESQILGNIAHRTIDQQSYSTRKNILQGMAIYSDRLKIAGKIDLYDTKTGILTERKRTIKKLYDGYIWQLYGQYLCLSEMGYVVTGLGFHSFTDNQNYPIPFPNYQDTRRFEAIIEKFHKYKMSGIMKPSRRKCERCIYSNLCDTSLV